MKLGQIVYTVNAKTNEVDEWRYVTLLSTPKGYFAHLRNGKKYCFLPVSCVYETREAALIIAKSK